MRESLRQTTNLYFYKSTEAKRILFKDCGKASGVLVSTAGFETTLLAKKEVILSAGAVGLHCAFPPCKY